MAMQHQNKVNEDLQEEAATTLTSLQSSGAPAEEKQEGMDFEIPQRFTKSGRKKAVPFPLKLMKVLSNKKFEHIVTWMPSGKAFTIVEPKAFVAEILPDHFKSAKYASFTRKLHRWGFMRHYRGEEAGAFYHKLFQKDRLDLVEKMTCHKEPATQSSRAIRNVNRKSAEVAPRPQTLINKTLVADEMQMQPHYTLPSLNENIQFGAAERLNAAIELEVARRIEERIQAAAVSRQTLALMNQLQQRPQPTPRPWNSLQAQLLQIHQQKQQLAALATKGAFGTVQAENKGLKELPTINVQGAKTA